MSNVLSIEQYKNRYSTEITPDVKVAQYYLKLLDSNAVKFQFACIRKKDPIVLFCDAFDNVSARLTSLNQEGYGIYVTVNETNLSGRRKESDIVRIRTVFEEQDNPVLPNSPPVHYPLQPSFVVESSPGKFHRYWLVDGEMSIPEYRALQRAIVDKYDCDKACTDAPRLLRIPGFYHTKDDPKLVKLQVYICGKGLQSGGSFRDPRTFDAMSEDVQTPKYNKARIALAFPPKEIKTSVEKKLYADYSSVLFEEEEASIRGACEALSKDSTVLHCYADWLSCGMAIASVAHNDIGLELWKHCCKGLPNYNEEEMDGKWEGLNGYGYTIRTLYYYANSAGWDGKEIYKHTDWPQMKTSKPVGTLTSGELDGWRFTRCCGKILVHTWESGWCVFNGTNLRGCIKTNYLIFNDLFW